MTPLCALWILHADTHAEPDVGMRTVLLRLRLYFAAPALMNNRALSGPFASRRYVCKTARIIHRRVKGFLRSVMRAVVLLNGFFVPPLFGYVVTRAGTLSPLINELRTAMRELCQRYKIILSLKKMFYQRSGIAACRCRMKISVLRIK